MIRKLTIAVFLLAVMAGGSHSSLQTYISAILTSSISPYNQALDGFRSLVSEKKGNIVVISDYNMEGREEREIISEIEREEGPDLIFTIGTRATRLARENIRNVPLVFSMVLNPEEFKGPYSTGVSVDIPHREKLKKVKDILPEVKRVGIVYSPQTLSHYEKISRAADELGLELVSREIESGRELSGALESIFWQSDIFFMIPDSEIYFQQSIRHLIHESIRQNVPVIGLSSSYTRAGAFISFDSVHRDIGIQAAELALEVLDGKSPEAIGVVEPRELRFSINLNTARRLGIDLNPGTIEEAEIYGN